MIRPEEIKKYRKSLGLTQTQFADLCSVSKEKVRLHWEKKGIPEKAINEAIMIKKIRIYTDAFQK